MKLLEFALAAVTEALRQDSQRQLLFEKTPTIHRFDFTFGQSFFPGLYDHNYPLSAKEKGHQNGCERHQITYHFYSPIRQKLQPLSNLLYTL